MERPILIRFAIIAVQALFTTGDLIARANLRMDGFTAEAFWSRWFLVYMTTRSLATMGQLYIFANVELGKSMAMFGAMAIVLSNAAGLLLLQERLTRVEYGGVSLAVLAFLVLAVAH
ncbi:MAG TPA: hypothetical protein VF158_15700 [Longimicrobiales bacterium]